VRALGETIALGIALLALGCIVGHCASGCAPSTAAKEKAADATYAAEHMRCVEANDTKATIDACRAAVRVRWGITETATKDGGR
jgi:hypothetical protein